MNDNNKTSIIKMIILNIVLFCLVFLCSFYIISKYNIAQSNNNIHKIAQDAAKENYKKEKEDKTSKLYRYNSDEFIDNMVTICKNEAKKGNFYLELKDKPFIIKDHKLTYVTDSMDVKESEYYTTEDMREYVEDDTLKYLQTIYGIELDLELKIVKLKW